MLLGNPFLRATDDSGLFYYPLIEYYEVEEWLSSRADIRNATLAFLKSNNADNRHVSHVAADV